MDDCALLDPLTAMDMAWRRMNQAIDLGRPTAALNWLKLHQMIERLRPTRPEPSPEPSPPPVPRKPNPGVEKVESVYAHSTPLPPRAFDGRDRHATGHVSSTARPP